MEFLKIPFTSAKFRFNDGDPKQQPKILPIWTEI